VREMSRRPEPDQDLYRAQRLYAERMEAATRDIAQLRALGTQLLSSGLDAYVQGDARLEIHADRWLSRPLDVQIRSTRGCVYKEVRIPAKVVSSSHTR